MNKKLLGSVIVFLLGAALIGAGGAATSGLVLNKDEIVAFNAPVGGEMRIVPPAACVKPEKNISCFFSLWGNTKKGYDKLPENWFVGSKNTNVLRIPDEQKYYNRHFETSLTARAAGPIATEISIPVWVETESRVFDSTKNLEKGFGFMPIALDASDKTKSEIVIYNNTGEPRTFNVFLIYPPQRSGSSLYVQSPGYEWLKEGFGPEINAGAGKKLSKNRFKIELEQGQIVGVKISGGNTLLPGQEVLIAAVPEGVPGFEFARIFRNLKGEN
jgi:hypothetical protein